LPLWVFIKVKNKIAPLGIYKSKKQNYKTSIKSINFLSCNNFIKIKNNLEMIEFVKKVSEQTDKKIKYYIIGEGKEYNKIKLKLNEYKKYFNFKMIKRVKSLPDFILKKNIHFFMNFSTQEGMSFSIMEAMSCGIPVISSNIDANKNLVDNSRGYLLNLKKSKNSYISVSKKILKDLNKRKNYINKKKKAKLFIEKNLINKNCYLKFLNELKKI